jgi:2-methylcitrate dehydratase PrpD
MSAQITRVLAEFAASLQYEQIPPQVRDYCKDLLLDALACAVAGHQGEETQQVAALARELGQSSESTVIGDDRLSLAGAALLNGYLITAVTMCDAHRATMTHVTPEVVPPALAIAERDGLTGRDLLVSLAVGCEVTTRVAIGIDYPAFRARGWHGPGVFGPFGAAAAVGRLLRFDSDAMARAFALAGSQAAGTFAAWGTPTVKFHQCRAALSGLMAALLAEKKFEATREFLTAKDGGLYNTYANGGRPQDAIDGLGARWELLEIALRPWPAASSIQGMMTALFDLVEQHALDLARVKKVRIGLSPFVFDLHGNFAAYKGKFEALLSAHYVAAAILKERAMTLAQFAPARYDDAQLRSFAEQIEVRADPALSGVQAIVEIETADRGSISARCDHPRGSPENRLSREAVEDKFTTYAGERLSKSQIESVLDAVTRLERLDSVRSLMDSLRLARNEKAAKPAPLPAIAQPA